VPDFQLVTLYAEGGPATDEVRGMLARALGGNSAIGAPDEAGLLEVEVDAPDRDQAITRVADALAATGLDERFTFPSTTGTHYEAPEHRAPDPDEQPDPDEPPHLQGGSPHDDQPAPYDEPPRDVP
jgi:hypothetical protein